MKVGVVRVGVGDRLDLGGDGVGGVVQLPDDGEGLRGEGHDGSAFGGERDEQGLDADCTGTVGREVERHAAP